MSFLRALSIVLLCTLMLPLGANAEMTLGGTDPLTVTVTPVFPRPYDTITIKPDSNLINLSASTVTIYVNGKVIETGSGTQSTTAQVGGPGSTTTIRVTATDVTGQTYAADTVIKPADVALIMSPVSTSHPFYEGASLVAPEGRVRLVAIPDLRNSSGAQIPAQSLVYTWQNGDKLLKDQSGIGRSVLDAVAPVRYRDATITLTVATQDGSTSASASVVVSPVDPILRVYRTSPLLGPGYEHAIGSSATMDDTEDTFRAVPYFFGDMPRIAWSVNGVPSETTQDITVRSNGSGSGSAQIGVTATVANAIQSASENFALSFGSSGGGGIFGL